MRGELREITNQIPKSSNVSHHSPSIIPSKQRTNSKTFLNLDYEFIGTLYTATSPNIVVQTTSYFIMSPPKSDWDAS
jgi:hypothetical protein